MKSLIVQMDKYALQNDIINKGYASFAGITATEDDKPGVPFTHDELVKLWQHKNDPWVDAALIYTYRIADNGSRLFLEKGKPTSKSITSKVYTHKDIEELRAAVELIKAPVH